MICILDEIWKDIEGYEGEYQVSNFGNVRSLNRIKVYSDGRISNLKGKELRQGNKNGYRFVNLGSNNSVMVHTLVAKAFIGDRPDKMDICHNNGIKSDNRVENLRYATRSENNLDGYVLRGYICKNQILTPELVLEIKDKLKNGVSYKTLSKEYGASKSAIGAINRGELYKWVGEIDCMS